jgi:hypothetical protein
MAVVPTSHTFVDGVATSSEMNAFVRDPVAFLMRVPHAHLRRTTAQSTTSGLGAPIDFDQEVFDDDVDGIGGHDPGTNPSRYTAKYPGAYQLNGGATFATNATGTRGSFWRVNGADVAGSLAVFPASAAGGVSFVAKPIQAYLNVGDYVQLVAFQSSGGALDLIASGVEMASMSVLWLSIS